MVQDPNKLLVVDDDASNRECLSRRLIHHGYTVEVAGNAPEALQKIAEAQYDLVLLDQHGPSRCRLDLLRLLRATHSQSDLPVIMFTPPGHGESAVDALQNGANDYVDRSLDLSTIVSRIQAQLSRVKAARRNKTSDPLTGLGNRGFFVEKLDSALSRKGQDSIGSIAVLLLDLDHFKVLNDSIGHCMGDRLLIEVAASLRESLADYPENESASLARLGGDEFALLFEHVYGSAQLQCLADDILLSLRSLSSLSERSFHLTASIGIAMSSDARQTAEELLGEADLAMCRARELGKDRCEVFTPALRELALGKMAIASDLRGAIEQNQLVAYYQPKIHLQTGAAVGFEALLRWRHPERGMILPSDFIPVAEETGQIIQLGEWILREACWQLRKWQEMFPSTPPMTMNVNLSVRQLKDPGLLDCIAGILAETGINPETLNLELTESLLMSEFEAAKESLSRLRALRIGLKLDDFGTGYSSLSYLQMLQFDSLKIDRSFISRIAQDRESRAIVRAMMQLAQTLKMTVVAEGIETSDQLKILLDLGCTVGQGYYFAKPLPASMAEQLLQAAVAA